MRRLLSTILFFIIVCNARAANVSAIVNNGLWSDFHTWSNGIVPITGDVVTIPMGINVQVSGTIYSKNVIALRPSLNIKIYGGLDFSSPGNDKLYLANGSFLQLFNTGSIFTTSSSTEIIAIWNGTADNTVWTGAPTTIHAPAYATSASTGFVSGTLAVNIESFMGKASGQGSVLLNWVSAYEQDAAYFSIERFIQNQWNETGRVQATNRLTGASYNFTDHISANSVAYRLKMINHTGSFSYSSVIRISANEAGARLWFDATAKGLSFSGMDAAVHYNLQVFTAEGRAVNNFNISAVETGSFTLGLPAGFYVVSLLENETGKRMRIKIIIP